jgi:hypothetical protein
MRCKACDNPVDFRLDEDFCPDCFSAYLENLEDICPEEEKEKINERIKKISQTGEDSED